MIEQAAPLSIALEIAFPHVAEDAGQLGWVWEPSVLVGLAIFTGAYFLAAWPLRPRFARAAPVSAARQASFLLGVLALAMALISPLDVAAEEYLFSAHMLQHLLLTLIAPPLLLLGTPSWMLGGLLRWPAALRVGRILTSAPVAFVVFNGVFWFWHWPALYDLALEQVLVHIVQHLTLIGAGVLLWWPVCGPSAELPRLSYPLQMLYLFLNLVVGSALGALITLQSQLAYTRYADAPRLWGLSPLDDQRLGGLIMWVGCGIFFLCVIAAVFMVWSAREEAEEQEPSEAAS